MKDNVQNPSDNPKVAMFFDFDKKFADKLTSVADKFHIS